MPQTNNRCPPSSVQCSAVASADRHWRSVKVLCSFSALFLSYNERISRLFEMVIIAVTSYIAVLDCAQPAKWTLRLIKHSHSRGENLNALHGGNKAWIEKSVVASESQHNVWTYLRRRKCHDFQLISGLSLDWLILTDVAESAEALECGPLIADAERQTRLARRQLSSKIIRYDLPGLSCFFLVTSVNAVVMR